MMGMTSAHTYLQEYNVKLQTSELFYCCQWDKAEETSFCAYGSGRTVTSRLRGPGHISHNAQVLKPPVEIAHLLCQIDLA
jgi:hypothetical protein